MLAQSIIGGALSIGGSIFGGMKASEAMKKAKENLEERRDLNYWERLKDKNEASTQRADAQRIMAQIEEGIKNRNRQAAATQAVMGGTQESLAATQAVNNEAAADAAARIQIAGDARKDAIDQQHVARDDQYNNALNQMEVDKANAIAQAVKGVNSFGSELAGTDFSVGKKQI